MRVEWHLIHWVGAASIAAPRRLSLSNKRWRHLMRLLSKHAGLSEAYSFRKEAAATPDGDCETQDVGPGTGRVRRGR